MKESKNKIKSLWAQREKFWLLLQKLNRIEKNIMELREEYNNIPDPGWAIEMKLRIKNSIDHIDSDIAEIQASCEHNTGNWIDRERHTHYEWTGNDHTHDYYTCPLCKHEISI